MSTRRRCTCGDSDCIDCSPPRITDAEPVRGGTKHDNGKPRFDLLSPHFLLGVARVLTCGAKKYAERNWEQGLLYSRCFAALMRHLWAWWAGEEIDQETGESHLDHAACCLMFLKHMTCGPYREWDDRPAARRAHVRKGLDMATLAISILVEDKRKGGDEDEPLAACDQHPPGYPPPSLADPVPGVDFRADYGDRPSAVAEVEGALLDAAGPKRSEPAVPSPAYGFACDRDAWEKFSRERYLNMVNMGGEHIALCMHVLAAECFGELLEMTLQADGVISYEAIAQQWRVAVPLLEDCAASIGVQVQHWFTMDVRDHALRLLGEHWAKREALPLEYQLEGAVR